MLADVKEAGGPQVVQIPVEVTVEPVVFKIVGKGYDPKQVETRIASLEQELAELRWEHDDLAAQRAALEIQREAQERWTPSFSALGDRVAEIVQLAEQEAADTRATAEREVRGQRDQAAAEIAAQQQEQAGAYERQRQDAERELRTLTFTVESRRKMAENDLAQLQRDAKLTASSEIARAQVQAQQIRDVATREAASALAEARAEVAGLNRQRDQLNAELLDLSVRLMAVVQRADVPAQAATRKPA
jgi:hypothetical protein